MQISSNPLASRPYSLTPKSDGPIASTSSNSSTELGIEADGSRLSSSELQQLLVQVREQPHVRTEVIEQARQRLAAGYYLTREAAQQSADVMLQLGE